MDAERSNSTSGFRGSDSNTIDLLQVEILSERVTLRPISLEYSEQVFMNFTEAVVRYMTPTAPREIGETNAFISDSVRNMQAGTDLVLVILDRKSEEFLGVCGLHSRTGVREPELGIWIKEAAFGRHIGREAVRAVVQWASLNLAIDSFIYPVDKQNPGSRKIAESLGGTIFKEEMVTTPSGKILDEVVYRVPKAS